MPVKHTRHNLYAEFFDTYRIQFGLQAMQRLQFTETETRLASERRLKFQGTAKVNLDDISFHPTLAHNVDERKLDQLRRIFHKEGCRRLDIRNNVTAVVSRTDLQTALDNGHVAPQALLTNLPTCLPRLSFPARQLQCLHGQHRIKVGKELLPPSDRWWPIDIYLDGKMLPAFCVRHSDHYLPQISVGSSRHPC